MFLSPWFVVPFVLLTTLFVLFMAFIMWLAHNLRGYPMFLILNANRGTDIVSIPLTVRSRLDSTPASSVFADSSGTRARNTPDNAMGRDTARV
jgi:hypothetical protein